eukprot:5261174-Prymnesium_polylepis.1
MRSLCRHCSLALNNIGHQGATAICEALKFNEVSRPCQLHIAFHIAFTATAVAEYHTASVGT